MSDFFDEILRTTPQGKQEGNFFKAGRNGEWTKGAEAWFLVKLTGVADFTTRKEKTWFTIEGDVLDSTNGWPFPTAKQWMDKHDDAGKAGIRAFFGTLLGEEEFAKLKSGEMTPTQQVEQAGKLKRGMAAIMSEAQPAAGKVLGAFVQDILTQTNKVEFSRVTWADEDEARKEIARFKAHQAAQGTSESSTAKVDEIPF